MTRDDECRAEILRLHEDYTPRYACCELDAIFTRTEHSGREYFMACPLYWLLREGAW